MKLRCELHLGTSSKVILAAKPEETLDHIAMKLAAFAMFLPLEPIVEPSADHPALAGTDFRPDMFALNDAGEVELWVECGAVAIHKLNKITRRYPYARVVVLKTRLHEAARLREEINTELKHAARIEIWTWPDETFDAWKKALAEKTELFGEAHERSFNLVVNHTAYAVDLLSV
jgi:uncharacterized protein YaeQ